MKEKDRGNAKVSERRRIDELTSDLLEELAKNPVPGRIEELAGQLQRELDRLHRKPQ